METPNLEFHPIADLFPLMEGKDFEGLVSDMQANGFNKLFPIILHEGKILDGRNRYRAAQLAKVEPEYVEPHINNPFAVVASANLHRRHLTLAQRAFIAEAMANMKHGGYRHGESQGLERDVDFLGREKAAKIMEISVSALNRARAVNNKGVPELVTATKNSEIELTPAEQIAQLPKEQQAEALNKANPKRKADKSKPKHNNKRRGPTVGEIQARSAELLKGPVGVSREEFDPEFKGTSQEFIDKHGHVQLWTKKEYEESNDKAAFSTWVGAIRDLRAPLKIYLEGKPFKPENFEAWVKRGNQPEKRLAEMKELASMIVRTKESIDWLISFLEEQPK